MATIEDFIDEINAEINRQAKSIVNGLEGTLEKFAEKIVEQIRSTAPRSGGGHAMADDFIITYQGKGLNRVAVVHAKKKGQILHLIEFGFMHTNGTYVIARPFMRPAFETFSVQMLDEVRRMIKHG